MLNNIIQISNLTKNYGKHAVLKGIDLTVSEGDIYGIIGKNGAGKSTLVDCVLGIKKPDSGTITINGLDIDKKPVEIRKLIGYVASEPTCYASMKGIEFLNFMASVYSVSDEDYKTRLEVLLQELDLSKADLTKYISEYSHGMKQKICLIASLIHDPKLWILDEPTVGLDVMTSEALKRIMLEKKAKGDTVLFISHNIEFVFSTFDRMAIIHNGIIAKEYSKESLDQNRDAILKEFYAITGADNESHNR